MHREKLPEKIPFRLTRMLIKGMDVSGIEGTFKFTCNNVMRTMRENRDSLMAIFDAFVYDPLINWKLMGEGDAEKAPSKDEMPQTKTVGGDQEEEEEPEALNERALQVITRVRQKLTGRDFSSEVLTPDQQVEKLINQATTVENLTQCYVGW